MQSAGWVRALRSSLPPPKGGLCRCMRFFLVVEMSTLIMSQCWPLQGMSPAQKAVLISLADNANDEGVCWPSVATISRRTCLSERSVQRAVMWLIDAGILRTEERFGRSTVYTITPGKFSHPSECHPRQSDTPTPVTLTPPPPSQCHPTPVTVSP